jgi:hypothetical protein
MSKHIKKAGIGTLGSRKDSTDNGQLGVHIPRIRERNRLEVKYQTMDG